MILSKATKRNIILFAAAFLLSGVLHVGLYYVDFTHCITTILGSALTVLWAVTVQKRIIDKRLRVIMLCITAALLFHFLLQLIRYDLITDNTTASRYIWYLMYLPMISQSVLCFFLAMGIHRPEENPLPKACFIIAVIGALLVAGALTNDMHFWMKSFPAGVLIDNGQEQNEWLYWLINIFIYGLYVLTLAIILTKNHRYVAAKYRWIIAIPLLIGIVYFVLYPLGIAKRFFPCHIWNMGEMTGFCVISTIEVCIQLGMIPANRGYESLFASSPFPAVILDKDGAPVYLTARTVYPFPERKEERIVSHPIQGGSIVYPVDVSKIQKLNQELSERVEQLETRNAYIAEETRVRREGMELQARNRIYERITEAVMPQIEHVDSLLCSSDEITEEQLARIAVLKAYIKRRSNMELFGESEVLPREELTTAVAESLEYVRLCGVNTASNTLGTTGFFSRDMTIAAYNCIEEIIEESLDTLSDIVVVICFENKKLTVRIMLTADRFAFENRDFDEDAAGFSVDVSVTREGADSIVVFTFTEGGERE